MDLRSNGSAARATALAFGLFVACGGSEVDLAKLEARVRALPPDQAAAELREALIKENEREAVLVSGTRKVRREFVRSLSAEALGWTEGQQFIHGRTGKFSRFALPEWPIEAGLSPRGTFAAFIVRVGSECVVRRLDLEREKLTADRTVSDCHGRPAVSDDGSVLFVPYRGAVHRPGDLTRERIEPTERTRVAGPFQVPYRRLAVTISLVALDRERAVAFVGAGGYYDLHLITKTGDRPLARGLAARVIWPSIERPLLATGETAVKQDPSPTPPEGWLLLGGSGQLRLAALLKGAEGIGPATEVAFSPAYAGVPGQGVLLIQGERASLRRSGGEHPEIPILMKRFSWFGQGLVYEEPGGRVFLRRTAISQTEMRIAAMLRTAQERASSSGC